MAVNLSPVAGAGWQFFDNNGTPLSGGLIYTYLAGTSTPQATYTTSSGNVANSNPIVLDIFGIVEIQRCDSNYGFINDPQVGFNRRFYFGVTVEHT